jgi:hypothetical protein
LRRREAQAAIAAMLTTYVRVAARATLCALGLAAPALQAAQNKDASATVTRLVFHSSPAVDLYFLARQAAAPGVELPFDSLAPAVEAARALDKALGGTPLAFAPVDGLVPGCETVADLRAAFERAPESLSLRGGAKVELRKGALAIAAALAQAEPAFQALWKERAAKIEAAKTRWQSEVGAKERELLAFHLASLGMKDPGLELPVWFVNQGPWPGAVTVRGEDGRGVSFVAIAGPEVAGSQLYEIVLHEVTHSLDLAADEASAFGELRAKLEAKKLDPRDRRLRDLPHALMFVQAAESVRRVLAPAHRDYGEVADVYSRLGPSLEALRGYWRDHLDGKLTQAAALDALVESLEPAAK